MEKVIRNGKVAVLFSPKFGAGWYTWNHNIEIVFNPKIVEMVEQGKQGDIDTEWIEENLGIKGIYCGGAEDLQISWLPINTKFLIDEYDGSESIIFDDSLILIA